jgi:hypothetical protein
MKQIKNFVRAWSFPVGLILAWVVTTAYSISIMATVSHAVHKVVASEPHGV